MNALKNLATLIPSGVVMLAALEGLECLDPEIHGIIGRAIAEALTERLMAPDG